MRVICIKKSPWRRLLDGSIVPGPVYHEECLVLREQAGWDGGLCYILKGYDEPMGDGIRGPRLYPRELFRPIPDISEFQALLTSRLKTVRELEPA